MEDKSKRTETVRPQFGECCESHSECDGVLSVKSDGNDIELNGETDDEDIWRTERWGLMTGVHTRAHDHTSTVHIMVQVLRDGTWCELVAQEIRCSR